MLKSGRTIRKLDSGTVSGFIAIILWSTTVAFARSISEQLGPVTAAAVVYGVSGAISVSRLFHTRDRLQQMRALPRKYLIGCGALFVIYMLVLFLAIGRAEGRVQVLEVGLLNYLWPALTILLSLVLLKKKANVLLLPGTFLALIGIFFVVTQGIHISWNSFCRNLWSNPVAYALGLGAAVSWALYSTLTRRWAHGETEGAVDLFLPATGMTLALFCFLVTEQRGWSYRSVAEGIFLGVATYLAYGFWDTAMRRGNVVLVAAASYLTPLLSTLVSCIYLAVASKPSLWLGCGMLVFGSLLSWVSISDKNQTG